MSGTSVTFNIRRDVPDGEISPLLETIASWAHVRGTSQLAADATDSELRRMCFLFPDEGIGAEALGEVLAQLKTDTRIDETSVSIPAARYLARNSDLG